MRVWWGHLASSGRRRRIRVQEFKGLKGSSHVTPSWNRWENGILERDVDYSGNNMACGCFLPALSHSQERYIFWGEEGRGPVEKGNGFQVHVKGFWDQEFRGQSTSLVTEFWAPGSASAQRGLKQYSGHKSSKVGPSGWRRKTSEKNEPQNHLRPASYSPVFYIGPRRGFVWRKLGENVWKTMLTIAMD